MQLTPHQIIEHGFTGKKVGEIIKMSKGWTAEQIAHFIQTGEKPIFDKQDWAPKEGSVFEWFVENPCVNTLLQSSKSQKRRWLSDGAVLINGQKLWPDDPMPEIRSLVFFSGSQTQITMQ